MLLELGDPGIGRARTPRPLECERLGHDTDGENAAVACSLGDDRGCAGAGTAAHSGSDEAHVRAFERIDDLFDRLLSRGAADLRPRSRPEALGNLQAKLDAAISGRVVERLRIGVGDDEIDALHVGPHHVSDGVAACATDTDDRDPRAKLVDLRPDEINAHDSNSPQCDNALSLHEESLNHCESQAKRKS
jgi:hypothetical protein